MLARDARSRRIRMATSAPARDEFGNTGYEIFVDALSVLSLVNIALLLAVEDAALNNVIRTIDILLSIVFLIDFSVRLHRAPSRADYFLRRYGWADLLASLPFPELKILRLFRLVRVLRLLRRNGGRRIVRSLIRDRAGSALLSLLFVAVIVLQFGSLAMIGIESRSPDANIKT